MTRAEQLAAGQLVPADPALAHQAGFAVPVALTREVHADCVAWTDADTERTGIPQDETGRLWDLLWMAASTMRRARAGSVATFQVHRWPRALPAGQDPDDDFGDGSPHESLRIARLAVRIGPGDQGEPVVTILHPNQL